MIAAGCFTGVEAGFVQVIAEAASFATEAQLKRRQQRMAAVPAA
jgi:hypothetical protein